MKKYEAINRALSTDRVLAKVGIKPGRFYIAIFTIEF